jgi:hypothetical protein
MQNGMSWEEANTIDPLIRKAIVFAVAMQNGQNINWETGEITKG